MLNLRLPILNTHKVIFVTHMFSDVWGEGESGENK